MLTVLALSTAGKVWIAIFAMCVAVFVLAILALAGAGGNANRKAEAILEARRAEKDSPGHGTLDTAGVGNFSRQPDEPIKRGWHQSSKPRPQTPPS